MHRWVVLAVVLAAFGAAGLLAAPGAATAAKKADLAAGQRVYDQQCAKCHGQKGNGQGPMAAYMSPKPTNFTDAKKMSRRSEQFLEKVIENGGPAGGLAPSMPAFKSTLSKADIRNVAAYVRSFAKGAGK